jgi:hypothetical protein
VIDASDAASSTKTFNMTASWYQNIKRTMFLFCSGSQAANFRAGIGTLTKGLAARPAGIHQCELTQTLRPGLGCPDGIDARTAAAQPKFQRETFMRNVILGLLAAGGLAVVGVAPAEAVGTRYPFCIQGDEYPGLSNCGFTSYEQCQATASGRRLWCIANPYYNPGEDIAPPPYRGPSRAPSVYPSR